MFIKLSSILGMILLLASCIEPQKTDQKKATPSYPTNISPTSGTEKEKIILFFGNSLTAAYRLDPSKGFVALIQKKIDSLGLHYKTVNAGLSGETTAGGKERIDWVLRQPLSIFMLELGGNDGLRGIDPASSFQNLQAIISKVKAKYPAAKIILAGMEAPPNMGQAFTSEFRNIYPRLAKKNDIKLIPFLLEGVAGIPSLNLPDGIHPNIAGQKIVTENLWAALKDLL